MTFKGSSVMKIVRFLLAGLLLFVVLTIVAFVYLDWWQALIVVLAVIVAIVAGVKYLLRNIGRMLSDNMIKLFEVKSQVLRGAEAQVHSVEGTPPPPPPANPCSYDTTPHPANYYRIEVTIIPAAARGPMSHWDLDDLRLIPFDTPATSLKEMADEGSADAEGYDLQDVKIMGEGRFVDATEGKYEGAQQLRLLVGVPPHVRALKFRYYSEQFGHIELPPPLPQLT